MQETIRQAKNAVKEQFGEVPIWVVWRKEPDPDSGEIKKVPYCPKSPEHRANSTDPGTWATYEQAEKALTVGFEGLGIVFRNDGLCGVDFDGCIDDGGEFHQWALDYINEFATYAEISPSGTGAHMIFRSDFHHRGVNTGSVEIYSSGRFFTFTGNIIPGFDEVRDCTEQHRAIHAVYGSDTVDREEAQQDRSPITDEDIALCDRISASKQGAKFRLLMAGEWGGDFPSPSEADLSLCSILAFWTKDSQQIDRIFRTSGLMRSKWDSKRGSSTIGGWTIGKALATVKETVQEPKPKEEKSGLTLDTLRRLSFSMADERNLEFEKMQPILAGWLLSGSVNMLHGPAGKGKTWIAMGAGLSLATGKQFIPGWDVHSEPLKVLMVDGEMPPDQLKERKQELANGLDESIDPALLDNLHTISNIHLASQGAHFLDLTRSHDRDVLAEFIEVEGFKVVFLDNLSCLIPGINIKASEEYSPFNVWLLGIKAKGVTVIFVHHDNKSDDFTGANEMTFALQTRLHIRGDGLGFKVDYPKYRHGSTPKTEKFSIVPYNRGLIIATGQGKTSIVADAVRYLESNGVSLRDEVRDYLVDLGHDKESVNRSLRRETEKPTGRFYESGGAFVLS